MLKTKDAYSRLAALLGAGSIFILPNMGMDPFGIPKLFFTCVVSFGFIVITIKTFKIHNKPNTRINKIILSGICFLGVWAIISTLMSHEPLIQKFYGVWGRNTGLLAFMILLIVLFESLVLSNSLSPTAFGKTLFWASSASSIYGAIQYLQLDPINYKNSYSPMIGFFGNPNFQSSILGLGILSSLWYAKKISSSWVRLFILIIPFMNMFMIYKSRSAQGFYVAIIGLLTFAMLMLMEKVKRPIQIWFSFVYVFGISLGILGLSNVGPLSSLFDSPSIEFRRIYWSIASRILQNNLLFGSGFDSYGDSFRRFRTSTESSLLNGAVTNAAHNVYLDFGVSAGLPFLAIYLVLTFSAFFLMLRFQIGNNTTQDFKLLSAVFVALHIEMYIGINQIGLAIWEFLALGSLLGYLFYMNKGDHLKRKNSNTGVILNSRGRIGQSSLLLLALILALPPLVTDINFRKALFSADPKKIYSTALSFPKDLNRMITAGDLLRGNGFYSEAESIAHQAVSFNPDSYYAWQLLLNTPGISELDKNKAEMQSKRLDPLWNPKNK